MYTSPNCQGSLEKRQDYPTYHFLRYESFPLGVTGYSIHNSRSTVGADKPTSDSDFANPAEAVQPDFGVGFELTASYGSAAVSFSNGTVSTIAKIEAEDGYKEVLQRLSLYSSRHPSPPYDNLGDSWDDMPRQYLRSARKAIGLPASSDVGFLAKMLSDLRASVEERVGPITSAGVTTLHLVALYDEDLHDAFEY